MSVQQSPLHPLDPDGGLDLGIPVRAVNRSEAPVIWQYDRKTYTLLPDTPAYVPYMAMVYWQGDPRSIDVPGGRLHQQARRQQREHLRVLYGVYEHDERWENIPLVECYPLDSDTRFETVLHDPEGTHLRDSTEQGSQLVQMREMMERQAAQLRAMQAQVAQMESTEAAAVASHADPADLDRQATEHRDIAPTESLVGDAPTRRAPVPKASAPSRGDAPVTRDGE